MKIEKLMDQQWKYVISALGYKPLFFHNWKQARRTARQLLLDDRKLTSLSVMTRSPLGVDAIGYRDPHTDQIIFERYGPPQR